MRSFHTLLQAGIAFTWAGLVLGLSFIETPLKFHAPGMTDVLAVGIGRLVFTTLNRIELVSLVILLASRSVASSYKPSTEYSASSQSLFWHRHSGC